MGAGKIRCYSHFYFEINKAAVNIGVNIFVNPGRSAASEGLAACSRHLCTFLGGLKILAHLKMQLHTLKTTNNT